MYANSIAKLSKVSANSAMSVKKLLLSITLTVTCLNPGMVLAQSNYLQIQQLAQRQQEYQLQVKNLQTEMGFYMLGNPQASAALLASGAGIAAVLTENLDPSTKGALMIAGAIGASYCMDSANTQYCAQVFTKLGAYAVQIENYNREINSISQQISNLQS
jgi:cell division protein FtsB